MCNRERNIILVCGLLFSLQCIALADVVSMLGGGSRSVNTLSQQANLVVIATLQGISDSSQAETVQLQVIATLKGQTTGAFISAVVVPPTGTSMPRNGILPKSEISKTGIWFLKSDLSSYQVLPLTTGLYGPGDVFLPSAGPADAAAPVGTVNQQLLSYLLSWYMSLPSPNVNDDQRLLISVEAADPQDSMKVINVLMSSPSAGQHAIGLAEAIRRGSDEALTHAVSELDELSKNPKFFYVRDAIGFYYKPDGAPAIATLQQLAAMRSDIPGLDAAVGSALQRIGTKAALPAMALLLDSPDPGAQMRASSFFGYFAMFADDQGNIPGTGVAGPFDSPGNRQKMPRQGAAESPATYAQYWKTWWAENRSKLGFATQ